MSPRGIDLRSPHFWAIYPFRLYCTRVTWHSALTGYSEFYGVETFLRQIWEDREDQEIVRNVRRLEGFKAKAKLGFFNNLPRSDAPITAGRASREGKGLRALVRGMVRVIAPRSPDLPSEGQP